MFALSRREGRRKNGGPARARSRLIVMAGLVPAMTIHMTQLCPINEIAGSSPAMTTE
jgi:hypothetical protein